MRLVTLAHCHLGLRFASFVVASLVNHKLQEQHDGSRKLNSYAERPDGYPKMEVDGKPIGKNNVGTMTPEQAEANKTDACTCEPPKTP
jgi:hypothetical protein